MLKFIKDNLSVISIFVALMVQFGILLAIFIEADGRILGAIFAIATALLILLILTTYYYLKSKDQNLIYTFFADRLLDNKEPTPLPFDTIILIIEDGKSENHFEEYKQEFIDLIIERDKTKLRGKKKKTGNNEGLSFIDFNIISDSTLKQKKEKLTNYLNFADAVLVILTNELQKTDNLWVFETLAAWAKKKSSTPFLMVDKLIDQKPSEIPQRYYFIPKRKDKSEEINKRFLPWDLLQRATERSQLWRNQASFNKLFAFVLFGALVVSISYTVWQISQKEKEIKTVKEKNESDINEKAKKDFIDMAKSIKYQYKQLQELKNENIEVSFWFWYDQKPSAFLTTEKKLLPKEFDGKSKSVIGCVFDSSDNISNKIAIWQKNKEKDGVKVWNLTGGEIKNHSCQMDQKSREADEIFSIACNSYLPDPKLVQNMKLGMCIFSTSKNTNLFDNNDGHKEILKQKIKELGEKLLVPHKIIIPLVINKDGIEPIKATEE